MQGLYSAITGYFNGPLTGSVVVGLGRCRENENPNSVGVAAHTDVHVAATPRRAETSGAFLHSKLQNPWSNSQQFLECPRHLEVVQRQQSVKTTKVTAWGVHRW